MDKKNILIIGGIVLVLVLLMGGVMVAKNFLRPEEKTELTSSPESEAKQVPTVKIGHLPISDHLILGITEEKDAKNFMNLKLEAVEFKAWDKLAEALTGGQLNGAFILLPLGIDLELKGANLKAVLLGHRDGSVIIIRKESGIKTLKDLAGKTIAIPSALSIHNILLHKIAADNGLTFGTDIKTVVMPPTQMPVALSTGEIQAYIVAEPFGAQAEDYEIGEILVLSKDIWNNHLCCILVMKKDFLDKNPKATGELIQSFIKSGTFIQRNPEEASEIGGRFLHQTKKTVLRALTMPLGRVSFSDLLVNEGEFNEVQNYLVDKMNLESSKVNMADWVDDQYARMFLE